ncbi:unnamed protein product [Prorocentrum cordatum]|nr:unnamed protein product [Polarella glacialis]
MARPPENSDSDDSDGGDNGPGGPSGLSSVTVVVALYAVMLVALYAGFIMFEGMTPVTCIYLIVQIVTTIGYGDVTPKSEPVMVFVALFTIMTLVVLAYFMNLLVQMASAREEAVLEELVNSVGTLSEAHLAVRQDRVSAECRKLGISTLLFLGSILFGTVFYSIYESCSCSYGETELAGCDDTDYGTCVETKGATKSMSEAFYFSVITLTTVGFGDFTPESRVGRWVGIAWMIFGVGATANWIGALSSFFFERNKSHKQRDTPSSDELFETLDADHDGCLTRAEHHVYLLRKQGILSDSMLQTLNEHFDTLDVNVRGMLDIKQMHERSAIPG